MGVVLGGLIGFTYLFIGGLLGKAILSEWNNDASTDGLSFWAKAKRFILCPISTMRDKGWHWRDSYTEFQFKPLICAVGKGNFLALYVLFWPLLRILPTISALCYCAAFVGNKLGRGIGALVDRLTRIFASDRFSKLTNKFCNWKESLVSQNNELVKRRNTLQALLREGEGISRGLSEEESIPGLDPFMSELRVRLSGVEEKISKITKAIEILNREEARVGNLARFSALSEKAKKFHEIESGENINQAVHEALVACEQLVGQLSSELVESRSEDSTPEELDLQIKWERKEAKRLRDAQEAALV